MTNDREIHSTDGHRPPAAPSFDRRHPRRCAGPALGAALAVLSGCAAGDGHGELAADAVPATGVDPAGVELAAYGLREAPCGDDLHLATVVTADRIYHAFCADEAGRTSVLVVSPLEAAPETAVDAASPLEYFLSITPAGTRVPELLEAAGGSRSGRASTADVVAFVHPAAGLLPTSPAPASSCSSASDFTAAHCTLIDEWIDEGLADDDFLETTRWCGSSLLSGDAQRTGSAQGVPFPWEARIRVAGCNADVLVRRYYQNPFDGTWWNAGNLTLLPAHTMSWKIFSANAHWCPGGLDPCQTASDMRFRVEPTTGATYRYTGGFVSLPPVP